MRPAVRQLETDDHAGGGRLAGAGLADYGQRAARRDDKGDIVDGFDIAFAPSPKDLR